MIPASTNQLLTANTGYRISRSLRFRNSATSYLQRTPASAGNRQKWTWSGWVKRGLLSAGNYLFGATTDNYNLYWDILGFNASNSLYFYGYTSALNYNVVTTPVYRDPSSWMHVVLAVDTTSATSTITGTSTDKIRIYINGVQVTSFSTAVVPAQNLNTYVDSACVHTIGVNNSSFPLDGYLAEVNFIDGQALTPSSFGAFDTNGVWQPKAYVPTGTGYGTNGFYLPFTDTTGSVGGNDTYAKVLLHGDGANNSTSILDSSWSNRKTFTAAGGAKISTTQSKFGGSSIYFDGANNTAVTCPSNADLNPSGDFTIDCWVYFTSSSSQQAVVIKTDAGGVSPYLIYTSGTSLIYYASSNNSSWDIFSGTSFGTFSLNTWTHIAIVRSGNTYYGFVNGVRTTLGTSSLTPTAQTTTFRLGHYTSTLGVMSGYIDEFRFSNGIARWTADFSSSLPTRYTGYIGADTSGNYNDWDAYNISTSSGTTYDSMIDSPTNYADGGNGRGNYAVLNPLDNPSAYFVNATFSAANLNIAATSGGQYYVHPTISNNTGKFYQEYTVTGLGAGGALTNSIVISAPGNPGAVYCAYDKSGQKYVSGSWTTGWTAWTANDVIGVAVDYDAGTAAFYLNGTLQGTLTFGSQGSAPLCTANNAQAGSGGTVSVSFNAGQRPFSISSVPSGFSALNTQNLPTPTIAAGNKHFDISLWTGDGSGSRTIANSGMQPDFAWIKARSTTYNHALVDVIRGGTNALYSNATTAETADAVVYNFNAGSLTIGGSTQANSNGTTYVGWQWKGGNGTSTIAVNAYGSTPSIASTVSANTSAGFSVVTWTGTGATGTIGHGLGVAPSFIVVKARSAAGEEWYCYHVSLGATARIQLNSTAAQTTGSSVWNSTSPTSTVFSIGNGNPNTSSVTYVAYCFAPVAGYSAFGSYTGNGLADGVFVYLGFRPKLIIFKDAANAHGWVMIDSSRNTYNVAGDYLWANSSNYEDQTYTVANNTAVDFLSNGFKLRNAAVNSGENNGASTYVYAAWAETPFKTSRAR